MRPSRYLILLLSIWLLAGLLIAIARIHEWQYTLQISIIFWVYPAIIIVIAFIDAIANRSPPLLDVERTLDPYLALNVRQQVTISIINRGRYRKSVTVTDSPPPQIRIEGLPASITLSPGESARIHYHITPLERGPADFAGITCRILSSWKLWDVKFSMGKPEQARVYPNYKPLFESSFINSEQRYSNWGIRLQQKRGEGVDFHQLRDFRIGDSLRQIDWRATARFSRPISREYQEERDQNVIFLLDCGRRMRAKDGDISHFDHALNALLLSAFIVLNEGDSVGLMSFAGQDRHISPVKGRNKISYLLDQVYDLHSTRNTSDYLEAAQQLINRQSKRALVILISSIEPEDRDDLRQAVTLLADHHLVVVASIRQPILSSIQEATIDSLESALRYCGANRQLQKRHSLHNELRNHRVMVIDSLPTSMHTTLISQYMALKRSGVF